MVSDKKPSILDRFIIYSETETKTIKVVSYGISSIALFIALYRIRPFAKFRKPLSIPSHFLHKKVPLQGTVVHIEPSYGTLLMVDHKPLIPLPRLKSSTYLPVKIAGVDATSNGISWLQIIVSGKNITFIPLAKEKEYLSCIVTMLQENQKQISVGEELVKLGFGLTKKDPLKLMSKDKAVASYEKRLLYAQKSAERDRNGYWHFAKHPTLLWKIQRSLTKKMKSVLPRFLVQ